jgi:hypothetical protein
MGRKCFISFKTEDVSYKRYIQTQLGIDMIDKSLDVPINSTDEDYILSTIRSDYLSDSTVTIHLIGASSAESLGPCEQRFIKRELQASLYDGGGNTRSGILGVVLPHVHDLIYRDSYTCRPCGQTVRHIAINDSTVVKEFSYNFYLPNDKCHYGVDDRYCVLVSWQDFCRLPESYIEAAHAMRGHPIASKVRVYPK